MKIDEILKKKRTLSFEVFPPKKDGAGKEKLLSAIDELRQLSPDFISVTYGAGGSNSRDAFDISGHIAEKGMEPLAHLTACAASPKDIERAANELKSRGVNNVLALRGDRPQDESVEYCKYFAHATDLMDALRPYGFTLGGACYPEGHIECETLYDDLKNMKKKQDCGAKFFITQVFYDNAYYYRLVHEAKEIGVTVPIIPGIMPLTNPKNIKRIRTMCGSAIPLEFRNMIEIYGGSHEVLEEIGLNYAAYQITDLIAKGAPGIHLYIMNSASTAKAIHGRLQRVFHEFFGN